jgi:hypothetical protein
MIFDPPKKLTLIIMCIIISPLLYAQDSGYADDFEDGVLTGWSVSAEHQRTYELSEENGVLQINYHRTTESWEWDVIMLQLPQDIDVSANPTITLDIKSETATIFSVKPHYSNGNNGWFDEDVYGDNLWRSYVFNLNESNYLGANLSHLAFYFDAGSTIPNAGTINFDNFKIAGYSIDVYDLQGMVVDSTQIDLSWDCNNIQAVDHFNIFRGSQSGFPANAQTKIGEAVDLVFYDDSLSNNTTYYYVVTAVDTSNYEYPPSSELRVRISTPGVVPSISAITSNSDIIGKYDKFELTLEFEDATYQNPFNPEEITLYAYFTSPEGDTLWVNGYYDNYQEVDEWKIRFSPDRTGQWEYRVYVTDVDGTATSEILNFSVQESEYHGWLQVSPNNSHYFVHDDGKPFYGVGVYYPWGITEPGLDNLVDKGANYFAYWNGNYDFEGGRHQIESARTGIGYYDQPKCGRIDQILEWAEERNLKMQFAIWPHDVLDETVWGYNGWADNAFKYVCDAKDFYTDSTSWEYQKKLYRYIIARWGHSRSMAVWELVNEVHGTDGWVHGDQALLLNWLENTHNYFKELDPYDRPTTIDKGRVWPDAFAITDMPNTHLYEHHWPEIYPNDHFRSSLYTYANVARQFYTDFEKPGIMAEAGGANNFFGNIQIGTDDYTLIYHNALWASWSNGLAITPVWWSVSQGWMLEEDLQQMQIFSTIAQEINYAELDSLQPAEVTINNADGFFMESDTTGFGWIRAVNNGQINGNDFSLNGFSNGTFQLSWIDTWTGNLVDMDTTVSFGKIMPGIITHELYEEDIALLADRIENGNTAENLNLFLEKKLVTYLGGDYIIPIELDSMAYTLVCFITDNQKRLVTSFDQEIAFSLEGPGQLENTSAYAPEGGVILNYWNHDSNGGEIRITATAEGLDPVVLVTNLTLDIDENQYQDYNPNNFVLYSNYPNPFNSSTHIRYHLPQANDVEISIYDINGRLITTLVDAYHESGEYITTWNSANVSSGIYYSKFRAGNFIDVKKCTLIK